MTLGSEEQARTMRLNSRKAISLALDGRWQEAVEVNRAILAGLTDEAPEQQVDALNRLGRAYMELHDYARARQAYQKAKELDPYNSIAEKNLKRLAGLKAERGAGMVEADAPVEPRYFIEDTGKAGVVRLTNLAPRPVLARMVAGDRVNLEASDGNLVATDSAGNFLGQVEARHGQRLARLMAGGNRYNASVISVTDSGLQVMIRESYQDPSQFGQLSFPSKGIDAGHPYVSEKLIKSRMEFEEEPADELYASEEEAEEEGPRPSSGEMEEEEG
jgi:tetratricopeptide (TPR) repeat protein